MLQALRKQSRKAEKKVQDQHHWREERAYWGRRIAEWYREQYGLALDPIQTDDARVPSPEQIQRVHKSNKSTPDAFLASGQFTVLHYLEELDDHGIDPRGFERILDFGQSFTAAMSRRLPSISRKAATATGSRSPRPTSPRPCRTRRGSSTTSTPTRCSPTSRPTC